MNENIDKMESCEAEERMMSERTQNYNTLLLILKEYVEYFNTLTNEILIHWAQQIEMGCYRSAIKYMGDTLNMIPTFNNHFSIVYHGSIFKRVAEDLRNQLHTNRYLVSLLINNQIQPEKLGELDDRSRNPEANKEIYNEKHLKSDQKIEEKTSDQYECFKCGERKTKIRKEQRRALDEGYNLLIKCVRCENEWLS